MRNAARVAIEDSQSTRKMDQYLVFDVDEVLRPLDGREIGLAPTNKATTGTGAQRDEEM